MGKISQAFLDRMDLCAEVPAVSYETLKPAGKGKKKSGMASGDMREIVLRVREIQRERYRDSGISFNSELSSDRIPEICHMTSEAERMMEQAFKTMSLSARGYHRVLRTARTIADIESSTVLNTSHIGEALCCRSPDRKKWRE